MTEAVLEIPWLPALVAVFYLVKKKKSPGEIIEHVIKMMIGWYMILVGAMLSARVLGVLDAMLVQSFGVHGGMMNTEVFGSWLLRECGNAGFAAFILAFLVNLLLARRTKKGYLFLTGHHLLFLSLMSVFLIRSSLGSHLSGISFLAAGIATGCYAYLSVRVSAVVTGAIHKAQPAGLANSAIGAALLGAGIGYLCGRKKKPEKYGREGGSAGQVTSLGVLTVLTFFLFLSLACRKPGGLGIGKCLLPALLYGTALTMIMQGLRMLLGLFIQLFWELGRHFAPALVAGLDSTAVISWSPGAWRAGFLAAACSGTAASVLLISLKCPFAALPGYTSLYFAGGVAGVYGNMQGGRRGAALSGAAAGAAVILLMSLFLSWNGGFGMYGGSLGETEYGILGTVLSALLRLMQK